MRSCGRFVGGLVGLRRGRLLIRFGGCFERRVVRRGARRVLGFDRIDLWDLRFDKINHFYERSSRFDHACLECNEWKPKVLSDVGTFLAGNPLRGSQEWQH